MEKAFEQSNIRLRLLRAVQDGRFRIEALDHPSPGFHKNTKVHPMFFKQGYEGVEFRNLLRDMPAVEAVQAVPDPKDFDTVLPPSDAPTQGAKLPLTLDEEESLNPVQAGGTTHKADEHPHQPDQLQAVAGSEALPWE